MSERKMWNDEEDNLIQEIVNENCDQEKCLKLKWSQVAQILQNRITGCVRTGKQCRQRWFNHLHPQIIKGKQMSPSEIDKLFQLQDKLGNKWASIAEQFQGRTDNYLKNFFYSSLRRAIRQINYFLAHYKKKCNIKPFKQTILTKILKIRDVKYRQKLNIKNQEAHELAKNVKNMLAQLSFQDQDKLLNQQDKDFRETLIKTIQEFNKNCKKRKEKKVQEKQQQQQSKLKKNQHNENYFHQISSEQVKKKAKCKPKQKKPKQKITKKTALSYSRFKCKNSSHQKKEVKQTDNLFHSPSKHEHSPQQIFINHIIDQNIDNDKLKRKKSLIDQLQQQNSLKQLAQQCKKLTSKPITKNEQSDFFRKSGVSCMDNQPVGLLTRKQQHEDNNKEGQFIYSFQPWKKPQLKGEVGLFTTYFSHDLVDPSLLQSISIGDNLPKMQISITDSSLFSKLFKLQNKTDQGNIN